MSELKKTIKRGVVRAGIFSAIAKFQAPQVVILRYHSVLDNPAEHADSIGCSVIHSSTNFAQQMEYLARTCNPISMDVVLDFVRGACSLPPRSVAITFDDGFADNLNVAVPIINRYGVPGAIYVMTGYVSSIPWYCTLRYIFAKTQRTSFVDPFDGTTRSLDNPKDRYQSYLACSRVCASTPRAEIHTAMATLEKALEVEYRPMVPIMLSWDGVREVIQQGHIIGSHSQSHTNMAYILPDELQNQMLDSRKILESETGSRIRHFSYPSPIMEPHWTADTVETCRAAGYDTAVTCCNGPVRRGDSPLSLKRIFANTSLDDFTWTLENMFAGRGV